MRGISKVLRKKTKREEKGQELLIWLDHDSVKRLEWLRSRFKKFDDSTLIAFSLKSLESTVNRIVRRRVLKNIRAFEKHD
jgi:hypothetical protein